MNLEDFRRASEAAERWLTFVSMAVHLGTNPVVSNVNMAYRFFFLPPGSSRRPVSDEYEAYRPVLNEWVDRVRAESDGPVEWEAGRGVGDAQYWSSAHEGAVNITDIALHLLALPGWYRYEWEEEDEPVKDLSPVELLEQGRERLVYLAERVRFTFDEASRLKERIRRERASILAASPAGGIHPINQAPAAEVGSLQPAPTVNLEKFTITFDGHEHEVNSELALRWVKVLADRPGEWVSASELKQHDKELDGFRPDRVKKRNQLPDAILMLIESNLSKGSRLNLPKQP